jgi:hypothetical protein
MTDWRKKSEPVEGVETYVVARDGKPYVPVGGLRVVKDNKRWIDVQHGEPVVGTHDQCWVALMRLQGMSNDWAMQYEGWAILPYEEKNEPVNEQP